MKVINEDEFVDLFSSPSTFNKFMTIVEGEVIPVSSRMHIEDFLKSFDINHPKVAFLLEVDPSKRVFTKKLHKEIKEEIERNE